ncbi:MAG: DUF2513 domain-containing protein [Acidobacteria bacterium]|nr:DUF2513 domain-containing protein [Acidobacteriota bacterium]
MKRDLNLIRKMVLAIEDAPTGFAPSLSFDGYTEVQVGYHAYLLVDAGLAKGTDVTTMGSRAPQALITSLTWAGHEFTEAARDESQWKKTLATVKEKGGAITFEVLKQLLSILMKDRFGIS